MGTNPKTDPNFGNGKVGGDCAWESPIHATTPGGNKVTVAYGKGGHLGEVIVSDGHVSGEEFYNKSSTYHDHYGPNGESFADRDAYDGEELSEILTRDILTQDS